MFIIKNVHTYYTGTDTGQVSNSSDCSGNKNMSITISRAGHGQPALHGVEHRSAGQPKPKKQTVCVL